MIKISKPIIEEIEDKVYLKAFIENEKEQVSKYLWYATSKENGKFFCDEVADAFVISMVLRAIKTQQDIIVDAPMSEKLYYNLNDSVLYAINKAFEKRNHKKKNITKSGWHKSIIICKNLVNCDFKPSGVGTGCSLGVDSFTVLVHHFFNEDIPPSYRISHLTLFNAGAYGSIEEAASKSFYKEVERTKKFAGTIGLPLVWVDSNIQSFYPETSFDWNHTYLNMGIVLSMQKLWKKYLYASSISVDRFEFSFAYSAHYEPFLLPHISTENTELIQASMDMRRSDKVAYIANNEIVRKNLYVCLKEQQANSEWFKGVIPQNDFLNCGHCKKCLRTMLQLDILGQLKQYEGIFDTSEWNKLKIKYIALVLAKRKENEMCFDLYQSILTHKYIIPTQSRFYVFAIICYKKLKKILRPFIKVIKLLR